MTAESDAELARWYNPSAHSPFNEGHIAALRQVRAEVLKRIADRLDAAEYEDYDTDLSEDGSGGYEYSYWAEGQGAGRIYGSKASDFIRAVAADCPDCGGHGNVGAATCIRCHGIGRIR